ncbi:hypothetical protein TNCV_2571101 [Trichonephila clavipes]|nr:hypothetical protein TNCV_2571101 [Trichonephila clavipes]
MEDDTPNMETDPPPKLSDPPKTPDRAIIPNFYFGSPEAMERFRTLQQSKHAETTCPPDSPPTTPDLDNYRKHIDLKKNIVQMKKRLTFQEHCIRTEKEFPDLTDDTTLAAYQKDYYDDLVSLKEHKEDELALFLPCPVLDCPENNNNVKSINVPENAEIWQNLIFPKLKARIRKMLEKLKTVTLKSKANDGFPQET